MHRGKRTQTADILLHRRGELAALGAHGVVGGRTVGNQLIIGCCRFVAQPLDTERHFIDLFIDVATKFKGDIYGICLCHLSLLLL